MDFAKIWSELLTWLLQLVPKIIAAGLILGIGFWASGFLFRLIHRAMERSKADPTIMSFFDSFIKIAIKAIIIITAVGQFVDVSSIIAAIAAAGVTIGLAMKDNLANVASGAQLIITRPFHLGDYVLLDGVEGTVERIEIMFTVLKTFDNKEIVIPNSEVVANTITNVTAMETRRLDLTYFVDYNTDLTAAKQLLTEIVSGNDMVLPDPAPLVAVGEHKDSSIAMVVKVWCKKDDYWTLYYQMQETVKLKFDQAGINIPFPQMDIHIRENH